MYYRFFGLDGPPFSITPDPKFVYFSERHQDALAHLLYGVGQGGGGGFVQLTGEVGTGKTTLCRLLLEELPEDVRPALILNPVLGPRELIAAVCDEMGVRYPQRATRKQLVDLLNAALLDHHARGGKVVLIIDEAQNLGPQSLEQIRLLTNLETHTDKLLQIILIGQPELQALLERPALRQLAQRITARYHLEPLAEAETAAYVRHRLQVAGAARCPFTPGALRATHRRASGVPRLVNVIADRALLAAFTERRDRVGRLMVNRAAREVLGGSRGPRWSHRAASWALPALVLVAAAGAMVRYGTPWPAEQAQLGVPAAEAWTRVAGWWHADWPAGGDPDCGTARRTGLACLQADGTWPDLRGLAVPVLLRLGDTGRWLPARAVNAESVQLLDGKGQLPAGRVQAAWSGQYAVLLRLPEVVGETLAPGSEGPAVAWLRERARELGANLVEGNRYDAGVSDWVRDFQHRAGLPPTGSADAATLVMLAARSEPGER